jgi:DNA-binding transcriptional MerR regulator
VRSEKAKDIEELDAEWMNLIVTARKLGLSKDDIRAFLKNPASPEERVRYMPKQDYKFAAGLDH